MAAPRRCARRASASCPRSRRPPRPVGPRAARPTGARRWSCCARSTRIGDPEVRRRLLELREDAGSACRVTGAPATRGRLTPRRGLVLIAPRRPACAATAACRTGRRLACARTRPRSASVHGRQRTTCSPASRSPKAIPTRSATGSPTRWSTCSSREYPFARVACETLATTNRVVIAGEVRPGPGSRITADLIAHTARMAIKDIGYEQDGLPLARRQDRRAAARAVGRHRHGRRRRRAEGRGRRRPGHHVRLRHRRDAGR